MSDRQLHEGEAVEMEEACERESLATLAAQRDRLAEALRAVLDAHHDCNDPSMPGTICSACAIAHAELTDLAHADPAQHKEPTP